MRFHAWNVLWSQIVSVRVWVYVCACVCCVCKESYYEDFWGFLNALTSGFNEEGLAGEMWVGGE